MKQNWEKLWEKVENDTTKMWTFLRIFTLCRWDCAPFLSNFVTFQMVYHQWLVAKAVTRRPRTRNGWALAWKLKPYTS